MTPKKRIENRLKRTRKGTETGAVGSLLGQGHGKEGCYGGLAAPFNGESTAKIVILPVPFDLTTTYQKGTHKGPAALIEASRYLELYDIETNSEVFRHGIYTAPAIKAKNSKEMMEQTYLRTKELLKKKKFVVTLGGEHSISYGPVKAHAEHFKKLTVLQFDAHADLAATYEDDRWSHACIMARLKEIKQVKKTVAVGIRSMSQGEVEAQDRENTFFAHDMVNDPHWISRVVEKLSGPIYITFDLDAFDSSLMPSTGTPEPGGLFWYGATQLLREVIEKKNVVGCDIVELLPKSSNPAPDFLAAKLVYKILSYKFQKEKLP